MALRGQAGSVFPFSIAWTTLLPAPAHVELCVLVKKHPECEYHQLEYGLLQLQYLLKEYQLPLRATVKEAFEPRIIKKNKMF